MRLPRVLGPIALGLACLLPLAASPAGADVLLEETFDYPDATPLNGTNGWTAISASLKPLTIFGGELREESSPGDNGEDCEKALSYGQASDATTYFSFKLRVPRLPSPLGGDAYTGQPYSYMATLHDQGTSDYRCWVGVGTGQVSSWCPPEDPCTDGDYTIQLSSRNTVSLVEPHRTLAFDVSYKVVAAYDASTGDCWLWVNPLSEADVFLFWDDSEAYPPDLSGGIPVDAMIVAQRAANSSNCYQFIDDLKVGTSFLDVYTPPIVPLSSDALSTTEIGPPPATGTTVDFGSAPIPADFFGPGSDPFDGVISFTGDPPDPGTWGETDVRILRSADPFELSELPSPYPVQVDVEIVELSLRSAEPITVTFAGSPTTWDVHLDLAGPQQTGDMFATKTDPNGGVFDMLLPVQPVYTFTNTGDPGDVRVLPAADPIVMEYLAVPWVHVVDPSLNVYVPPGATFVPGVLETPPGTSASQRPVSVLAQQIVTVTGHSVPTPGVPGMEHTVGAPPSPVPPEADLVVEKTVDLPTPHEGETVTYTVVLTNNGPSEATGVVVTDVLPAGLTFVSSTPAIGSYDDGTGEWTVGSLAVGGATLLIAATVDVGNVGATISNTASVTAVDQTDTVLGNETGTADVTVLAGVGVDTAPLPVAVSLEPGRPNPSGAATTLRFGLPAPGRARLAVYDVSGGLVRVLADGAFQPGWHARAWDGRDASGRRVAPGIYFVRLQLGRDTVTRTVVRMN